MSIQHRHCLDLEFQIEIFKYYRVSYLLSRQNVSEVVLDTKNKVYTYEFNFTPQAPRY